MDTNRRGVLRSSGLAAVLLTGLAGCMGDDTDGTRPTDSGGPGVSITATDTDIEIPIAATVEVLRETATADRPPRLETTLTNTSDEPVRVGEGRAAHFEYVSDTEGLLTLLPAASPDEYPAEPDCWRLTEGIAITEEYRTFDLAAGESRSRSLDLYASPDADGCLPVGDFSFETTVSLLDDDTQQESSATWGFTLTLE